jgi:protein SCO1
MRRRPFLTGLILIAALAVLTVVMFLNRKPVFRGAVIDPPMAAAEIKLSDQNGREFRLSSFKGRVVALYFGYTNCPDECPLTMALLKQALEILGDSADEVQVAMITTDPARDTPQALADFMAKFNPTFLGLTGSPDELAGVWKDYGVTVLNGGETHSNFIYVIDRAGNLRLTFLPDTPPEDAASDLKILLSEQ